MVNWQEEGDHWSCRSSRRTSSSTLSRTTTSRRSFNGWRGHIKPVPDAKLEVSLTSSRSQADRFVVQLTLTGKGYTLRAQETRPPNLFAAVDTVTDVMDRQIRRYKGKGHTERSRPRRTGKAGSLDETGPAADAVGLEDVDADDLLEPRVVRTKRFPVPPMFVEDAILEMELLDHSFFLFYNIDSREYNVAYRRQDGDYGVIEPETG